MRKRMLIILFPVIFLTACGDSSRGGVLSDGTFKASMGEIKIDVKGTCGNINKPKDDPAAAHYFFDSDYGMAEGDTTGDGIRVNATRTKMDSKTTPLPIDIDVISLKILVNGESYTSGLPMPGSKNTASWKKTATGFSGQDQLSRQGDNTGTKYPITFEVKCN